MEFSASKSICRPQYAASTCAGVLIVLWFCIFTSSAQTKPPLKAERAQTIKGVERDLDAGRIYEGLFKLKRMIQSEPNCADAYFYLGTIYMGMSQYIIATQYARKAIELDPRKGAYHNLLGAILLEEHNTQEALKEFNQALADTRLKHAEKVWANIAYSHEKLLQWNEAIRAFNSALALQPHDVQLQVALAKAYVESDHPMDAIHHLLHAARQQPNNAEILTVLGTAYGRAGETAAEVEVESKAVTLDPRNKMAHYVLGQAFMQQGQKEKSARELKCFKDLEVEELENQQRASKLDSLFLTATAKLDQGELAQASELLQQITTLDPEFVPALYSLGFILLKQAEYGSAITVMQKAVALSPLNAGAYFYLGNAYQKIGRLREALDATQHAIVIFDQNTHYFNQLGEIYMEAGRESEAKTAFEQAIKLDDKFALAQLNLGTLSLQRGEVDSAVDHLEAAVKLRGDSAETRRRLGLAYCNDERFDDCIAQYKEAVRLNPADEQFRATLAEALVSLKRWTEAEQVLSNEVQLNPKSGRVHYNLGELYYIQGRLREALPELKKAAEAPTGISLDRIYVKTGMVYFNQLEFDNAVREFQKALQVNPDLVIAHLVLANLYARQGHDDEATKEYSAAFSLEPKRPDVYTSLAQLYFRTSSYARAIEASRKALELDQQQRQAEYILAQALIRIGRVEEGRTELAKFRKMEEQAEAEEHHLRETLSLNQEALSAFRGQQYDKAIALLRKAVEHNPEMGLPYLRLGFVLMKTGQHHEAIMNLHRALELNFDVPQIHHYLAEEYKAVGRLEDSAKERSIYTQMQEERMRIHDGQN